MNPARALESAARRRAADTLRDRLASGDPSSHAQAIWGSPGARRFTAADPVWRVHAHGSMFLAGLRALMLQALHPVAMAGVTQNSSYREDPWGRLRQISGFISMTTYGPTAEADRLMARVRGVHRRIGGEVDGRAYRASDPDLLTWVHCAEIDSFLDGYQRFSGTPLTPAEADVYVAQAGEAGSGIGVPDPPRTVAGLGRTLAAFRPDLRGGPDARDVVDFLRSPSDLDRAGMVGYRSLFVGAVATLPPYARQMLGINWSPLLINAATRAGQSGVRAMAWMLSDPSVQADRRPYAERGAR
ncbi:oxygenase MpaB family protein [Calidifontibacter terrae]